MTIEDLEKLIQRSNQGDAGANDQILRQLKPQIENLVRKRRSKSSAVRRWEETGDTASPVLMKLHKRLSDPSKQFENRKHLINWLGSVIGTTVTDSFRQHKQRIQKSITVRRDSEGGYENLAEIQPDSSDTLSDFEMNDTIASASPDVQKLIKGLKEGRTQAEIARAEGKTTRTVRNWKKDAISELGPKLRDEN